MIYLRAVIIFLCHLHGITSEDYYVIPTNASNMTNCPSGSECHTLSYYYTNPYYFSRNGILSMFFLEGQHEADDVLYFYGFKEITLKGLGEWVYNNNSSKVESTVIISSKKFFAQMADVGMFKIETLTIVGNGDCCAIIFCSSDPIPCTSDYWLFTLSIKRSSFNQFSLKQNLSIDDYMYRKLSILIFNSSFTGGELSINHCKIIQIFNSSFVGGEVSIDDCKLIHIESSFFTNSTFRCSDCLSDGLIFNTIFRNTLIDIDLHTRANDILKITDSVIHYYDKSAIKSIGGFNICCQQANSLSLNNVTIANNSLTGMFIDGRCFVIFEGQPSKIADNHSPSNGGGMWVRGQSTILSDTEAWSTTVSFINNTANGLGGAVYVEPVPPSVVFFRVTCSLKIFPFFSDNSALVAGDNIYGGVYFGCNTPDYYYPRVFLESPYILPEFINCNESVLFKHFPRPISSYVSTDPFVMCSCNEFNVINCSKRILDKEIYPGQDITLSLVAVGQCGGASPSRFTVTGSNGVEIVTYSNQQTGKVCRNFTYGIRQGLTNTTISDTGLLTVSLGRNYKEIDFSFYTSSPLIINIHFLQCPFGLHHSNGGICDCNDVLTQVNGITCNVSKVYPISRSGNNWLYYSQEHNCTVAYKNCPFDYCNTSTVYLSLNQSDLQCTHNRSGILCGQCQEGQSVMLGSNQCGFCDNKFISLIVVFIVAGFLLVLFLLMTNLTISTGSINGLLFYANIIKLNQPVSFNGTSVPVLTQFISWINLDFGIETCFYNGLDDYVKTWLQFTFPLYIWLLIICIIIGCHYSVRMSRYCGNNSVPVLATLIVMSFTKISRTITKGLMMSSIKCDGKQWRNVWSVDGNIEYLSGKHIPLLIISLMFLLIGVVYTAIVFCSQWLQRYGGKYCRSSLDPYVRLKPFIDAHTGPYKDKNRFWTGLLLMIRFILTGVFSYTTEISPQVNNFITALVSCSLLSFVRGKYSKKYNTILEMFYLSNLFITSSLNSLSISLELNINQHVNGASVGLSLVVFIGILLAYIVRLIKRKFKVKYNSDNNGDEEEQEALLNQAHADEDENEEYSPAPIINRRESLIFDFED